MHWHKAWLRGWPRTETRCFWEHKQQKAHWSRAEGCHPRQAGKTGPPSRVSTAMMHSSSRLVHAFGWQAGKFQKRMVHLIEHTQRADTVLQTFARRCDGTREEPTA